MTNEPNSSTAIIERVAAVACAQHAIDQQQAGSRSQIAAYIDLARDVHGTLTSWLIGDLPFISADTAWSFSRALVLLADTYAAATQPEAGVTRQLTAAVGHLVTLLQLCESPLEQAFLIGMAAYGGTTLGWPALLAPEAVRCQVPALGYRVDIALQELSQSMKLAIELDGHTYHERTEEQAVHDRARDRALVQAGWTVLRFHRKDIEQNLASCVQEVARMVGEVLVPGWNPAALPDDADLNAARAALAKHHPTAEATYITLGQAIDAYHADIFRVQAAERGVVTGLPTGFRDIDEILGGLPIGSLITVAAWPAVGKSALVQSIAYNVATRQAARVGYFSFEASRDQLVQRLLAMDTMIETNRLHNGTLNEHDLQEVMNAMGRLAAAPFFIEDTPGLSVADIRRRALRLRDEVGLNLLVVDYFQLIVGRQESFWGQDMADASHGLKRLGRELGIPVLLVVELGKIQERRTSFVPMLSDLHAVHEALEQDSDVILFLHREELYDRTTDKLGITEVHVAKNRNGPIGVAPIRFTPQFGRMSDLTYRDPEQD